MKYIDNTETFPLEFTVDEIKQHLTNCGYEIIEQEDPDGDGIDSMEIAVYAVNSDGKKTLASELFFGILKDQILNLNM
jgi:hypothetical protein